VVQSLVLPGQLETMTGFYNLKKRLSKIPKNITIAILLTQNLDQLLELVSVRSLLDGIRTILVIPDDEKSTRSLGHLLRPTLLTFPGAYRNFIDVSAVLSKCLNLNAKSLQNHPPARFRQFYHRQNTCKG
jgi:hypothetical protein